jgi:hypothetical protein
LTPSHFIPAPLIVIAGLFPATYGHGAASGGAVLTWIFGATEIMDHRDKPGDDEPLGNGGVGPPR